MINGKIHYKWSFSIAMLNYQRVILFIWGAIWVVFHGWIPPFATGPCRCPLDLRTASRWKNWWRRQAAPARPPKKRFEDADREHRSCNGRSGNLETQKSWKIIILKMNYTQKMLRSEGLDLENEFLTSLKVRLFHFGSGSCQGNLWIARAGCFPNFSLLVSRSFMVPSNQTSQWNIPHFSSSIFSRFNAYLVRGFPSNRHVWWHPCG